MKFCTKLTMCIDPSACRVILKMHNCRNETLPLAKVSGGETNYFNKKDTQKNYVFEEFEFINY